LPIAVEVGTGGELIGPRVALSLAPAGARPIGRAGATLDRLTHRWSIIARAGRATGCERLDGGVGARWSTPVPRASTLG
jgi:hypothetical protein